MGVNKSDVPRIMVFKQESVGATESVYSKFQQVSQSWSITTIMLPIT